LTETLKEDNEELHVNDINEKEMQIVIENVKININFGVFADRELNKNLIKSQEKDRVMGAMLKLIPKKVIDINFYEDEKSGKILANSTVVKFLVDFKTNYVISKEHTNDPTIIEAHKMMFETELKNEKTIFKILRRSFSSNLIKSDEEIKLKIADFDNFLNGNNLI
jgi:hypothetical protein